MGKDGESTQIVRFGIYEADLQSRELRKNGHKVPLQGQPFQVFAILLQHSGKLVTREELRLQVWPEDTFVDFDHGLNTAITKIRSALGDSADSPRFVETMPRRGYRFIDSVDSQARIGKVPAPGSRIAWVLIASLVCIIAISSAGYFYFHRAPKLAGNHSIIVADFANTTGDPAFDGSLRQGLAVQLEQSPFLKVVSDQRIQQTLRSMGQPADARLTPDISKDLCQRTESDAVLNGSVAQIGARYLLTLRAVNCVSGNSLASTEAQARDKNAVLDALGKSASEIRNKLGESLSSVEKYSTPLAEATTPSLEALKAYSLARKTQFAKGDTAALPVYKRAVELDANFAMPYAVMSQAYSDLNEVGRSAEYARKAYDLREKVSERERFYIEGIYYSLATGELEKAAQVDEQWLQTYPRDDVPYRELGLIHATLGNLEQALEETREALRLEPTNETNYLLLGNIYTTLNRLDEAEAVLNQAEQLKLNADELLVYRYGLAFLKGDTAKMNQVFMAAMGRLDIEHQLLAIQADTEGWYGKLKNAHELTQRAMDSARHNDANEAAATYQVAAALREVESGIRTQARTEASAALKLAPNRDVRVMAALALARAGDTAAADKLAVELDKTFPLDTLVQRYWLPTIRAAIALERKDPNRAIELLKVAGTIELGEPAYLTVYLCPVYLRGEAYLMLHDGKEAAAEFQKFIDHRGLVVNFPWGALAQLGLARAFSMQDDVSKARAKYQDFLLLWKDADPDIPILIAAKSEYAKLYWH